MYPYYHSQSKFSRVLPVNFGNHSDEFKNLPDKPSTIQKTMGRLQDWAEHRGGIWSALPAVIKAAYSGSNAEPGGGAIGNVADPRNSPRAVAIRNARAKDAAAAGLTGSRQLNSLAGIPAQLKKHKDELAAYPENSSAMERAAYGRKLIDMASPADLAALARDRGEPYAGTAAGIVGKSAMPSLGPAFRWILRLSKQQLAGLIGRIKR